MSRVARRAFLMGLLGGAAAFAVAPARARQLFSPRPPIQGLGPSFRDIVAYDGAALPGQIVIRTNSRELLHILPGGRAERYRISVGRQGFGWSGKVSVGARKEWPAWRPPAEMRRRSPDLPESVPPGPYNPLGARALYLYRDGRDTLYRIHGTNDPDGVGFDNTSGCFRLTNTDILYLYGRVDIGTVVEVVPE